MPDHEQTTGIAPVVRVEPGTVALRVYADGQFIGALSNGSGGETWAWYSAISSDHGEARTKDDAVLDLVDIWKEKN